jgi:membrane protein required for colicin V production
LWRGMTGFDIVVLLIVGAGAVIGFLRGFVQEILSLFAWIFAIFAIHYLHTPLYEFMLEGIGSTSGASVLAFAVLLLVPYATIKALANKMGESSRNSLLGPIDRVLGFGFGTLKGVIIVVLAFSVLVLGFDLAWGIKGRPIWITQARTYPFVNAGSEKLVQVIAERRKSSVEASSRAEPK